MVLDTRVEVVRARWRIAALNRAASATRVTHTHVVEVGPGSWFDARVARA